MLTGWAGSRTSIARTAAIAALLFATLGTSQALAQVTLRIEPVPVQFPAAGGETTFQVWVDNVPSTGLGSVDVFLNEDDGGVVECLSFVRVQVDPNLRAAWGNSVNNNTTLSNNVLRWTVNTQIQGLVGPSGNILVGTVTYNLINTSQTCTSQHNFSWTNASTYGASTSALTPFALRLGSPWVVGAIPDIDLTLTCQRVADPNDALTAVDPNDPNSMPILDLDEYVDGQTVMISCDVTNQGTNTSPQTTIRSVISQDNQVNSLDTRVIESRTFIPLAGGATRTPSPPLTGTPIAPLPGPNQFCTKIDVNSMNLDAPSGVVLETDESNNVDCLPITILPSQRDLLVDPNTATATPSPLNPDPNTYAAGLLLDMDFDVVNEGIGAVRADFWNEIRLDTSLAAALANPNSVICSKFQDFLPGQLLKGKRSLHVNFGFDPDRADPAVPPPNEVCQVPFTLAPGTYSLVIRTDSTSAVTETTPMGGSAEGNNTFEIPIVVDPPLPPEFRIRDGATVPSDLTVNVFDPNSNPRPAAISVISVQKLAAYSARFQWSPVERVVVADPVNDITFTGFLEQNGRIQTCNADTSQIASGIIDLSCTSVPDPDPNISSAGGTTQGSAILALIDLTANTPGSGTLTISNVMAFDDQGNQIQGVVETNGVLSVSGTSRMRVINAVAPPSSFPGVPFNTTYDLENYGFGQRNTPIQSRIIISTDGVTDPITVDPDVIACTENETSPIAAFSVRPKSISCTLQTDLRPGSYTGFYQVSPYTASTLMNQDSVVFPISTRVATLRKSGKGQKLEITPDPDMIGGTTGATLSSATKFNSKSFTSVRSTTKNRNWLVRLKKTSTGKKLMVENFPRALDERLRTLTRVRLPKEDKAILGAADIDMPTSNGNDELIILQRTKDAGDQLDFRRVDYVERRPVICQSAAVTAPNFFTSRIVSATGIEFDGSPGDEIAVLTEDGALNIYDLTISGSLPPASPCRPVPTVIEQPADAELFTVLASDPGFGTGGDEALSICTLDYLLDGTEELGSLYEDGSGVQSFRIHNVVDPNLPLFDVVADDPAFGGTQSRGKARGIACTR